MLVKNLLTLSKSKQLSAIILAMMLTNTQINDAKALTADDVFEKLDQKQRYSYISGAIGGIAYSRFLRDKPSKTGMPRP